MPKNKKRKYSGSHPDESYMKGTVKSLHLDKEVKALSNLSFKKDGKEIPVNVQIANYLKSMRLIEQEVILRKYVKSSIIAEAMSKSDRDEVRRIARSEMDRYYKEDIKPKVTKEVEKLLKGKVNKDVILDVTKKVLRKFHREIYFDYTPVLNRIKI